MGNDVGKYVRGEVRVDAGDASAGVAIALYDSEGTAVTLGNNDRLSVTEVVMTTDTAGVVTLAYGDGAAGKRLLEGTVAANGGVAMGYVRQPLVFPKATAPKFFHSETAATSTVSFTGHITLG